MTKKRILLFATLLLTLKLFSQSQDETPIDSLFAQDIRAVKLIYPDLYVKSVGQFQNIVAANSNVDLKTISIKYPQKAMVNGTEGKVYARFLIDTLGVVKDIKIIKGLGDGCSDEVLRVINIAAQDKWNPIIVGDKKVITYQIIYIKFSLE